MSVLNSPCLSIAVSGCSVQRAFYWQPVVTKEIGDYGEPPLILAHISCFHLIAVVMVQMLSRPLPVITKQKLNNREKRDRERYREAWE